MDVDELRATLRQMQRVRADETLPAYLRECAEPFVESLASIFERADGVAQEPRQQAKGIQNDLVDEMVAVTSAPASVTVEQDGSKFVVRGDETLAKMVQALLAAAAGKRVGELSGRLFALAIEAAGAGL